MYDPQAMDKAKALLPPGPQVEYAVTQDSVPEGDALVVATEWPQCSPN